jgi:hypothetical protein
VVKAGEVGKHADDEVLPTKPLRHLSNRCALHLQRQHTMFQKQALSGRFAKNKDISANHRPEMDLHGPTYSAVGKFGCNLAGN